MKDFFFWICNLNHHLKDLLQNRLLVCFICAIWITMVISQKSTKRPMTLLYKHSNEKLAHILEKFTVYLRKELWAEKWIPKTNRTVSLLIVERGIQGKTYFSRIKEDNKVQVPILYKNISESNIPICYPQEPKFWHCTWMWFDGILWKKKKKFLFFFFLRES